MTEKLGLLYEGKSKKVFTTTNPYLVWLEFKDEVTAFNGQKKGSIDKSVLNTAISTYLFELLEKKEIPTYFVRKISSKEMLVKAVEIIPVEFIVRNITAGALAERMGVEEGIELKSPVLEFCYKNDELSDPMINEYHIKTFKLASEEHLSKAKSYALHINDILSEVFRNIGIILVDFKLEFGIDSEGEVILADGISPDSCRLWDGETNDKLDKDKFRRDLGRVQDAYMEIWKRLRGGK